MEREWGFWTRDKLEILSAYLPAFTTASKRAGGTVYLDLYAGTLESAERDTGELILGSASRALDTSPAFTRCYFFELPAMAAKLRENLADRYPGKIDYEVVEGDSNATIAAVLADLKRLRLDRSAIFAFIDPYNLGAQWSAVEKLAQFKAHTPYKVELLILIFSSAIPRVLGGEGDEPVSADQVSAFFGTDHWTVIKTARDRQELSPANARDEYVNLYRWRLENELSYKFTHCIEIRNTSGSPLYHLVHATDHSAGSRIISHVYGKSTTKHEAKRRVAHERRRIGRKRTHGQDSLFSAEQIVDADPANEVVYTHLPTRLPYGME